MSLSPAILWAQTPPADPVPAAPPAAPEPNKGPEPVRLPEPTRDSIELQPDAPDATTRRFAEPTYPDDWRDLFEADHEIFGSEKEEKYDVNAFIVEIENWPGHYSRQFFWLYRHVDYPRYRSTRLLPFYYHLEAKGDNREKTVSPFYYSKVEGTRTYTAFWPLLPFPVYVRGGDTGPRKELYSGLIPFYYVRDNAGPNGLRGHLSWSWFHYLEEEETKAGETSTFFAPLLPVYFAWKTPEETHRNLLYLIDWKTDRRGDLSRLFVFPFYFHKAGPDGYTYSPLYLRSGDSSGDYFLTWGYYSSRDYSTEFVSEAPGQKAGIMRETRVTPFTYSKNVYHLPANAARDEALFKKTEPIETVSSYNLLFVPVLYNKKSTEYDRHWSWVSYSYTAHDPEADHISTRAYGLFPPILPVYYRKQTKDYTHTNIALLYDRKIDAKSRTLRHWVIPFYFYSGEPDEKSESVFIPPYQHSVDARTGERSTHVWPLYFSWSQDFNDPEKDVARGSSTVVNPLWYSKREQEVSRGKTKTYSSLKVPLVPILYSSEESSEEGSYRRVLNTVWERGKDGKLKTIWFMPFYWHSFEPGGYLHAFPFYHRPQSTDPTGGLSFGFLPPFYHSWEKDRETFYLLNYYSSHDDSEQRSRTIFFPIVFKSREGVKRREIIIPYKYEYEDEDEYYRFILGVSLNQQFGPLSPDLSFGVKGDSWYFDTELAVFFNLFSFEKRVSFQAPDFLKNQTAPAVARETTEKLAEKAEQERARTGRPAPPRLERKFVWNKDEYRDYWGWSALFGLAAHKKADGVNHVRILPLYWFTWHEDNSEGITTVPGFYLNYKSENTRYFFAGILLLPFYAHQSEGESYTNVYPLYTWISSYDAEKKLRKHRYLFGLAGWSSGPTANGSYVIPFYYHNRETEGNVTTRRTFFPIYYSRTTTTPVAAGGQLEDSLSWSPVHWHSTESNLNKDPDTGRTLIETESKTFGLPLYYRRVFESRPAGSAKPDEIKRDSTFFLLGYYAHSDPASSSWSILGLIGSSSEAGSGRTALLPLYYGSSQVSGKPGEGNYYSETNRWIPLAFLYHYRGVETGAGKDARSESNHWSLLFDYDSYSAPGRRTTWELVVPFIPILYYGDVEEFGTTHNVLMGIVYHYENNRSIDTTSHSTLWSLGKVLYGPDRFEARLFPLFGYASLQQEKPDENQNQEQRRRWWVFPLAYYNNRWSKSGTTTSSETTHLSPLYYWNRENRADGSYRNKFFITLFPLIYSNDEIDVVGRDKSTGQAIQSRESRSMFLPFYYDSSEELAGRTVRETSWILPYYAHDDYETKSSTRFVLPGIYFKTTPDYRRRNFMYLYDTVEDDREKYTATRFLFGAVSQSQSRDEYRFSLLYRGLYGVRYRNDQDYDRNILWWISSRQNEDAHNSFVPFWYYDREGESRTFSVLGPLGWYDRTTPSYELEIAGLGLAWFRYYDRYERNGIALAGLGMAYMGEQENERGYHSHGVLWNLLWQHQYETENRYQKTSILKGLVYSKVTDRDGKTWRRVLGIKFGESSAGRER